MRALGILAIVISGFLLDRGNAQDPIASKSSDSRDPNTSKRLDNTQVADVSKTRGKWFLELISESNDRPFPETEFVPYRAQICLHGYLFEAREEAQPAKLFPAMGTELTKTTEVEFYVGSRILDLSPDRFPGVAPPDDFEYRSLTPVLKTEIALENESITRDDLRENGASTAAQRPQLSIKIARKETALEVSISGERFEIAPGAWTILHEGTDQSRSQTSYHRLIAILHEGVEVASFDALDRWNESERLQREGPYEAALAATEQVLLADPTHQLALQRWVEIKTLIDSGKVASALEVRLMFPQGVDTREILNQWKQNPTGLISISDIRAPEGVALTGKRIDSDSLRLPIPSGRYRVVMLLPGFRQFQQEIEINGRTKLEIPLKRATPK